MAVDHYLGNPLLKKANTTQEFTEQQVVEFSKCIDDPIYFAKNYISFIITDLTYANYPDSRVSQLLLYLICCIMLFLMIM